MSSLHSYFSALLKQINPDETRSEAARKLPAEVRAFLQEHEFETSSPHTRLIGSYFRDTAVLDIKDVDLLLFVPESQLDRTPNALLLEVKRVLDEYPDATADCSGQRRSVRLAFSQPDLVLDIVPAVAEDDPHDPLKVPDRESQKWIDSNPLGYADRLTVLNQDHAGKVVPLVKLFKAWRNEHMKARRPKSYVLEAIVFYAVRDAGLVLKETGWQRIVAALFDHVWDKYEQLFEEGTGVPRIPDPGLEGLEGYTVPFITRGWERSHFETFMRRIEESKKAAARALNAETDEEAREEWAKVFGSLWPTEELAKSAARAEALLTQPGRVGVGSSGLVVGSSAPVVQVPFTRYHGR